MRLCDCMSLALPPFMQTKQAAEGPAKLAEGDTEQGGVSADAGERVHQQSQSGGRIARWEGHCRELACACVQGKREGRGRELRTPSSIGRAAPGRQPGSRLTIHGKQVDGVSHQARYGFVQTSCRASHAASKGMWTHRRGTAAAYRRSGPRRHPSVLANEVHRLTSSTRERARSAARTLPSSRLYLGLSESYCVQTFRSASRRSLSSRWSMPRGLGVESGMST